jgi:hypothetical protein
MTWFARWRRCVRKGHDWFPNIGPSPFIPMTDICLRCRTHRTMLPWGTCVNHDHPLADHYDGEGNLVQLANCPGPA